MGDESIAAAAGNITGLRGDGGGRPDAVHMGCGYAFANGDPLTFADPGGTSPFVGGGVGSDPSAQALLDRSGFQPSGAAAMCEMVDQAQAGVPGMLSNLESMFTGTKRQDGFDRLYASMFRMRAHMQPR